MASAVLSSTKLLFNVDGGTNVQMTASSGSLSLGNAKITGVTMPTDAQSINDNDVANRSYVDVQVANAIQGLDVKDSCVVATTANIADLTSVSSVDNVTLANNDRVLVKDQNTQSQNGIYKFTLSTTTLARADDMAEDSKAAGTFTFIEKGTNADKGFVCTTDNGSDTVGTHDLVFTQFSGAGSITAPQDGGLLMNGTAISINSDGVTNAMIADNAVDSDQIAADAVTAAKLADDAVVTANIVDSNVTTAKIAADAVTAAKLADDAVVTANIVDSNVTTAKIAADAVTAAELADDAVVTANIVDSNVTTAKIADSNVTTGKLADNAVTTAKLGTIPITTLHDVLVENNSVYIGNDPSNTTSTAEKNVAVGTTALDAITEGDNNVAVGYDSLTALTTGSDNVSIGFNTLMYSNGVNNVAIGSHAMAGGSTGEAGGNVAIGKYALYAVDFDYVHGGQNGGVENVVIGSFAGSSITTGHHNICIGSGENGGLAPQPSTESGVNQIVIGHNATGQANNSVTLGNADVTAVYCAQDSGATLYAGGLNLGGNAVTATAAELNILDGVTATAAELNILDGVTATAAELNILDGVTATAAELNILDGVTATAAEINILAGLSVTGEQVSQALAVVAITTLGTSENNKAVTQSSGGVVTIGATGGNQKLNIASHDLVDGGLQLAGTLVTASAAELNILDGVTSTAAELNLLDGSSAGTIVNSKAVVYGSGGEVKATSLIIPNAGYIGSTSDTDAISISAAGVVSMSATTESSSATTGALTVAGGVGVLLDLSVGGSITAVSNITAGGTITSSSDMRLKKDIVEIDDCVDKVKKLRGVNFKWIQDDREDFGVIAQEVEEVAPHAVIENKEGMKSVDYGRLTTLLIQAVKEQQATIENQQQQIDELKKMVTDSKA